MKVVLFSLVALFGAAQANAAVISVVSCNNSNYSFSIKAIIGFNPKAKAVLRGSFATKTKAVETDIAMEQMATIQTTSYPYRAVYTTQEGASEVKSTLSIGKITQGGAGYYVSQLVRETPEKTTTYKMICVVPR